MLKQLRRQTLVARLTISLVCPWLLAGCAVWSEFPDRVQSNASLSEADMALFGGELRPLKGDAESIYGLGMHYQKRGKHHWAIEEFNKVIAIDPHHARAYNAIGVSLDKLENFAAAQKAYRHAIEIDAKLDCAWNNLGYSAMLQGHPEKAATYYQKALALNSDNPSYRNNLLLAKAQLPTPDKSSAGEPPHGWATAGIEKTTPQADGRFQDKITSKSEASPHIQSADQLPESVPQIKAAEVERKLFSAVGIRTSSAPAAGSAISSADIPEEVDRRNETIRVPEKRDNVSVATAASPESRRSEKIPNRVALITEELVRTVIPTDVASTMFKLANDSNPIVQTASNEGLKDPGDKSRVITVKSFGPQHNGFRFTIKPVLRIRAQEMANQGAAAVLTLAPPGIQPAHSLLTAASIRSRIQVPEQLNREIADAAEPYVKVVNGNGVNGMAGKVGQYLARQGFSVGHAANANHFNHHQTVLYFPPGCMHFAWEVAKAIPGYQEMKKTVVVRTRRAEITLLIGRDVVKYQDKFHRGA